MADRKFSNMMKIGDFSCRPVALATDAEVESRTKIQKEEGGKKSSYTGNTSTGLVEQQRKNKIDGKEMINCGGKNWWQCPDHKSEKYGFDGLYVTHKPRKGHQEWLQRN